MSEVTWQSDGEQVWVDGICWAIPGLVDQERLTDPDEVTVTGVVADHHVSVRHHIDQQWDVRIVLDGPPEPIEVNVTAPGPMWGWLAGARAVVLARGDRSWWVGSVRQGDVHGSDRWWVGAGNQRRVFSMHWQPVDCPAAYVDHLPTWLPESLVCLWPEELTIPVMDEAVESPALTTGEVPCLQPTSPGWWPVEVHGPRGTTRWECGWAPAFDEVLAQRVHTIGDRTTVASLVVLSAAGIPVDDLAARVRGVDGQGQPLTIVLLASEVMRTGDATLAQQLMAEAETLAPAPGALLSLVTAWLALVSAGADPTSVVTHMAEISADVPTNERLVVQQRPDVVDLLGRVGFGFPGRVLGPVEPVEQAQLVVMMHLVTSPGPSWCRPAGWIAEQAQRALLAAEPDDETLAWLTLSRLVSG